VKLSWPRAVIESIRPWAEAAYPREGCGLLLGDFLPGDHKRARRFAPLKNLLRERAGAPAAALAVAADTLGKRAESGGEFEFVMDPAEFARVSSEAAREGLDVVGVLHTHPDHPAKPSPTDAAQPMLSGYSVVIVKVDKARFVEARSWYRADEKDPFQEETVEVEGA
jgi:proteasome lid subunit RPN8/RPN11